MDKHQLRALLPFLLLAGLVSYGKAHPDRWEGFATPDPSDETRYDYAGVHPTLASCRELGYALLHYRQALADGYYECGRNCAWAFPTDSPDARYPVKTCETVVRHSGDNPLNWR